MNNNFMSFNNIFSFGNKSLKYNKTQLIKTELFWNENIHLLDKSKLNLYNIDEYFNILFILDMAFNNKMNNVVILKKNIDINNFFKKLPDNFDVINLNDSGYIINKTAYEDIIEIIDKNEVQSWVNILSYYSKNHNVYNYNNKFIKITNNESNGIILKVKKIKTDNILLNTNLYWINLKRSIFRRKFFKTFVEPYFQKSVRVDGVDGYNKKYDNEYEQIKDYCSRGEFGCIKSHIMASNIILKNNDNISLVTEDDVYINYDFLKNNLFKFEELPKDWEILQIMTSNVNKYKGFRKLWNNWDERHWSTGSYLINNLGAKKINNFKDYKISKKNRIIADFHLYEICKSYTYKFPLFFFNIYNSSIINNPICIELNAIKYFEKILNNNIQNSFEKKKIINKKLYFICMVDKESLKNGTVDNLKRSLNNDLIILDTYDMEMKNLSQIFKMKEFLDNDKTINDDDLICLVDANDVIWLPNKKKEDFINLFIEQNIDLLFGAEIACAKHDKDVKNYFNEKYKNKPFKYLNGGFILGYKSKYHFMINDLVKNFKTEYFKKIKIKRAGPWINSYSNQRIYSRFMLKNETKKYMKIELDCDRKFVWNQSPTLSQQPFDVNKLNTFFFHVTFLAGELQMKIYKETVDNFFPF